MKQPGWLTVGSALVVAGFVLWHPVRADIELTLPDGRRVLLKDDRTWQYLDSKAKDSKDKEVKGKEAKEKEAKDKEAREKEARDKIKEEGEAVLRIDGRRESGGSCHFALVLVNDLRYPIRSLVPEFTALSSAGAIYDTVFSGFTSLKPGDSQRREIQFRGVACQNIARVQVVGGDRCDMGELQKFSYVKGQCLARVRVLESDLVRFDK